MTTDEAIYHTVLDKLLGEWISPEQVALDIATAIAPFIEYAPHGGHK